MRFVTLAAVIAFFSVVCLSSTSYAADTTIVKAEKVQFIHINTPYASVYKTLDPKAEIIEQAKKGDYFEILGEGTSWYLVKAQNSNGWIEKRAGTKVDSKGSPMVVVLLVIVFVGLVAGVAFYFVSKSKATEPVEA